MKTAFNARDEELDMLTALLDRGSMKIFTGAPPAGGPESDATGTLLATLGFNYPSFSAANGGITEANPLAPDEDAKATGKAGWFRCYKADGTTAIIDGTIGDEETERKTGERFDIVMRSTAIQQHTTVAIDAFSIELPE